MQPIHILLVEDNEGDIFLTKEALEEAKMITKLTVVRDGTEAIEFLAPSKEQSENILPDLVLLDVNLPRKNGHEVLQYIKSQELLKHIPVIMLTTSSSQRDIDLAYKNYVNSYITKPVEAEEYVSLVAAIEEYWISKVKLPSNRNTC
jgi:CheY-like chemotaxis protein